MIGLSEVSEDCPDYDCHKDSDWKEPVVGDAGRLSRQFVDFRSGILGDRWSAVNSGDANQDEQTCGKEERGVEVPGSGEIAVEDGVKSAEGAASGAIVTGEVFRGTARIKTCCRGVVDKQNVGPGGQQKEDDYDERDP